MSSSALGRGPRFHKACGKITTRYSDGSCSDCSKAKARAYAAANRITVRAHAEERRIRRVYGITGDQYRSMLARQGGRCAICRTAHQGAHKWNIDHDHKTGAVRGVLCGRCNRGLGLFGDDPSALRAAIDYLTGAAT